MELNKKKYIKLAIMGKMCSGKTTLSNHIKSFLLKKYNIEIKSYTFAGKVYELAYDLFDMSTEKKIENFYKLLVL